MPGDEAYSAAFDRRQLGLAMPPRVESYRGFLFMSFNPAIPAWSITLQAQKPISISSVISLPGMEIVSGSQAYSMRANWKLLVENSMDGYHARTTHQRYFEYLVATGVDPGKITRRRGGGEILGEWACRHPKRTTLGTSHCPLGPGLWRGKTGRVGRSSKSWPSALAPTGRIR